MPLNPVELSVSEVLHISIELQHAIERLENHGDLHMAFELHEIQVMLTDRMFGAEGEE